VTTIEEIPQTARERLDQIGASDLVIGLVSPAAPETLEAAMGRARESIAPLHARPRTVVIHAGAMPSGERDDENLRTLSVPLAAESPGSDPAQTMRTASDRVFAMAANLNARAVALIVSDLDSVTPQWIYQLARPVLELDFDLVTPCYAHARFEGLLNSAIVAPLTRALYGRRIYHPLGPDFGVSGRLAKYCAERAPAPREPRPQGSLAVEAVVRGFEVCQANVGVRHYPATDWMNQSSVIVPNLDPLFREIEQRASWWQRIRSSQTVPVFGDPVHAPDAPETFDTRRMVESFQLACRNLGEVWGAILPPGTMLELGKLARQPLENFRVPDRLWARVIYDFALAHRLRILNPDHVLRALTPLYLAWVASYALESDETGARLEQVSTAFEESKPYALSRWRWPDRFTP
jgi:glucosylglycerate synthase